VLGAPSRAADILASMCKLYEEGKNTRVKPDVRTYTLVINACAYTKHKKEHREALAIALRTFDQLKSQKDIIPNSFIFCNILYACKNLIPKDSETYRISLAKEFFELCSKAGYVNDYVLRALEKTVSRQQYIELVGNAERSSHLLHRTHNVDS
jgi:hypothetical protein